jgi:hypothetical protein
VNLKRYESDPLEFILNLQVQVGGKRKRFGDIAADFQLAWLKDVVPSIVAVSNGTKPPIARFWTEWTKGCGKDFLAAALVLWLLIFSRRMLLVQIAAVDKEQAAGLRRSAKEIIEANKWIEQFVTVLNWSLSNEHTNAQCDILASDIKGGSHGGRPDLLILNELSHVEQWELPRTLMDNASKMPHGVAIALMNAGFKNSEAWSWRENSRESDRWHFTQYTQPAPWITPEELDDIRRRNPVARVDRLFFGVWGDEHGTNLSASEIKQAVCLLGPVECKPANIHAVAVLIDLALTRHSAAVAGIGWDIHRRKLVLMDSTLFRPSDFADGEIKVESVKQEVIAYRHRFDAPACGSDAWQAVGMLQDFLAAGTFRTVMRVNFNSQNKTRQAQALLECLRDGILEIYEGNLAQDLRESTIVERASGVAVISPENERGHCDTLHAVLACLPELLADMKLLSTSAAPAQRDMSNAAFSSSRCGELVRCDGGAWDESNYPMPEQVVMRRSNPL